MLGDKKCILVGTMLTLSKFPLHLVIFNFDDRLNDKGREQCAKLSNSLEDLDYETLVVSPLRRTLETAVEVFERRKNVGDVNI